MGGIVHREVDGGTAATGSGRERSSFMARSAGGVPIRSDVDDKGVDEQLTQLVTLTILRAYEYVE